MVCEAQLPLCECMAEIYLPAMNPDVPLELPDATATDSDAVVHSTHCVTKLLANGFSLSGRPKSLRDVE